MRCDCCSVGSPLRRGSSCRSAVIQLLPKTLKFPTIYMLHVIPRVRYPVYIDAGAYVSNLKHKLAAGSPLLMVTPRCGFFCFLQSCQSRDRKSSLSGLQGFWSFSAALLATA